MNITLLGHHDIASLHALDRTIALLPEHQFTVLLSRDKPRDQATATPMDELARADADLCDALLAGQIAGREALQPPVLTGATFNHPNTREGQQQLTETQPDVVVSIRYRKILKEPAIAIPRLGVLNLHSGILPDYRGVMATFWAMLAAAPVIGSTLHRIVDSGIDTGPIIDVQKRPMRPDRSYLANVLGLYNAGCDTIARAVRTLAAGGAVPVRPAASGGDYYSFPSSDDIVRFRESGLALVDATEQLEL